MIILLSFNDDLADRILLINFGNISQSTRLSKISIGSRMYFIVVNREILCIELLENTATIEFLLPLL